ncbi:hypothetical protein OCU04_010363 [Sclerotinia nivalis]|uniref:Anaphase-promoting complex subunit 11 n=1 Tax=Sclerotinia nivalis TaxID=352851 RepID=A0A9X0AEI6_9HELO|nr:hypothetical protein OCU04_010363 [Sclerotinia nivalis]
MPSEENSGSAPTDQDYAEYEGAAEDDAGGVELSESVEDGDLSGDLTDDEHQDAELSERLEREISDYFSRNAMDRQHVVGAFRVYQRILLEHRDRSTSSTSTNDADWATRVAEFSEQRDEFLHIFMSIFDSSADPATNLGTRDQAIDNLLIPAPVDEESKLCPICNEIYDATTEDGKSLTNHGACMLPDCEHVFGRECINIWLKDEEKNTCPMCRAKIDLPSPHNLDTFSELRELLAGVAWNGEEFIWE